MVNIIHAFVPLLVSIEIPVYIGCYPNTLCGADGSLPVEVNSTSECCLSDPFEPRSYSLNTGSATCQLCFGNGWMTSHIMFNTGFLKVKILICWLPNTCLTLYKFLYIAAPRRRISTVLQPKFVHMAKQLNITSAILPLLQ